MKSLLTCALCCFASCLFAQIPKGKIMSEVGLNFRLDQNREDYNVTQTGNASTSKQSSFNITTSNRYYFEPNAYVISTLAFSKSTVTSFFDTQEQNSYSVSVGLGALRSIGSKFYIGTDFNIGIAKNEYRYVDIKFTSRNTNNEYFSNLTPKLYYHIHPKFLIVLELGDVKYTYSKFFSSGYTIRNNFTINLLPRFWNYGFIFLWGKSKEKT